MALGVYRLGVIAGGGLGVLGGMYEFLTERDLIPNNRTGHVRIDFDKDTSCRDILTTICEVPICGMYGIVGGIIGGFTGACLPLAVPIYGLIKLNNKYNTNDNEIIE